MWYVFNFHRLFIKKSILSMILVLLLWDLFKLFLLHISNFLGYNLFLNRFCGYLSFRFSKFFIIFKLPSLFPSIKDIGLFENIASNCTINNSWEGLAAFSSFLFLSGLLTGGYYGTLKDSLRERKPRLKTFLQFSWYYGPRFFLLLLLQNFLYMIANVFIDEELLNAGIFFLNILFVFLPYSIVMEDWGLFEALVFVPKIFFKNIRHFIKPLIGIVIAISTFTSTVNILKESDIAFIATLLSYPVISTVIKYKIMIFYNEKVMTSPVSKKPREHIRGYGGSILKTFVIFLMLTVILGLPTFVSKIEYIRAFLPWHEPVLVRESLLYKTEGARVFARENGLTKGKLVLDSIEPSKDEIIYAKPGFIRGKGRLITKSKTIYFSFELSKSVSDQSVVYSLQNGGKIEASDCLWGNPIDRGMALVIDEKLECFSGIIYDKMDFLGFETLYSPERDAIFLGPVEKKNNLYGFYACGELPASPVEFQWVYNRALPINAEGEIDAIRIMEKLNVAFETLDIDMLLNILYYATELKPENILELLNEKFSHCRSAMEAKGFEKWEQNCKVEVSYYPVSSEKMTILGDYNFPCNKIVFRSELFKIGKRWKITKLSLFLF